MKLNKFYAICSILGQFLFFGTIIQYHTQMLPLENVGLIVELLYLLVQMIVSVSVFYGLYHYRTQKQLSKRTKTISITVAWIALAVICYICNSVAVLTKRFFYVALLEVSSCLLLYFIVICEKTGKNKEENPRPW